MIMTNWGYVLSDAYAMPDIMDPADYEDITGRADDETRVQAEIASATAAIRNFVGWHLYPSLKCRLSTIVLDRRVTFVGRDLLIQLPARFVTAVSLVTINESTYTDFYIDQNGLLRVWNVGQVLERYAPIVVEYTAGIDCAMIAPVKELLAYRVMHSLATPPGITSEASGGVSVTYNANWVNNANAGGLTNTNREVLMPYRVQGVF